MKAWSWGILAVIMGPMSHAGDHLGNLTWPEAAQALETRIVVVPFSAGAKQHGPHLPLATDRIVMDALLDLAVRERNVLVAPPVLHGWFPAFRDYPGTEIADPVIFQQYVQAIAESLIRHGARRLVLFNLGIRQATGLPLSIVARDLVADHGVAALVVSWDDLETGAEDLYEQERGGHADEGETSIILHLRPDLVRLSLAAADYRDTPRPQIGYRPGRFDRATEPGVYGDPALASAEKGAALLDIMGRNWLEALDQFAETPR